MDRDSKIIIKRYIGIFVLLILLCIMWLITKILWLSIIVAISIYIVIELLIWKITNYRECKPKKLLENKWKSLKDDPQGKMKLIRFALGRGYGYEDISSLLGKVCRND
jgi:uncharacterized membrane protein YqiK